MEAKERHTFEVPLVDGLRVPVDAYMPPAGEAGGIVLLCHGFKGHRRWGFLPALCRRLRDAGLAALSMDFSHNGYVPGPGVPRPPGNNRFDPDMFRKNTITREINDLGEVVRYLAKGAALRGIPPHAPVGLYGHSRGALSVILHALESEGCRAICTWATTSDPNFYTDKQTEIWRRVGWYEFPDSQSGSSLALDVTYLEDLEKNAGRFRLLKRVGRLNVPHLLVHGTMDLVVPARCSEKIHQAETNLDDKHLVLLKTGHTFGFTNQSSGLSQAFETASGETVSWFQKYLIHGS